MQRLKILGVALIAVFVLSVVVSATSSAAVTVLPGTAEETWKGESGKGTLEVLNAIFVITCATDKSEGTIEANKPLGLFHIDFEGCKSAGKECTGLGEAKEVILTLGTYHMVFDTLVAGNLPAAGIGVLFLIEPTHFTCSGILFIVEGQVLCLIKTPNVNAKHFEIKCDRGAKVGDPGETTYWDESGKEVKMGMELLLTKENEKPGVMSSELTTALILTTNNIELMT